MKALLTGGGGFVGSWLQKELTANGHEAISPGRDQLEVTAPDTLRRVIDEVRPDVVIHLAAVAFGPDATADPARAVAVNVGGTIHLMEALRASGSPAPIVVASSAEVYGIATPEALPLNERAPLSPTSVYGITKVAAEAVAWRYGAEARRTTIILRAFNQTGPGQRAVFVVPALAQRILDAKRDNVRDIAVGNVDVRRDFCDVRDVVRAYRLVADAALSGRLAGVHVLNVASGSSVSIRSIAEELAALADADVGLVVDPHLVRPVDAPEMRGDARAIKRLVGWTPAISWRATLSDVLADVARASGPRQVGLNKLPVGPQGHPQ